MDKVKGFLGIDVGEFELRLDKTAYKLGETIHGTFEFVLKKPRKANKVWVKVQAVRTIKKKHRDPQGHQHSTTDEQIMYSDGLNVDGQKEYLEGRYSFDFPLPSYIQGYDPPGMQAALESLGGVYRDLAEGAWTLLQRQVAPDAPRSDQIEWTVSAGLSFSFGVSPSRSVRIGMGRAPGAKAEAPPHPAAYTPPPPAYSPAPPAPAAPPVVATLGCPSCGRPSPRPNAKFCTGCGSAMTLTRTCRCGEKLEPQDKFCTSCGSPA